MTEELMMSILFPILAYLLTAVSIFLTYEIYHSIKKDKANWRKLYNQEQEIDKLKKEKEELLTTIANKVRSNLKAI
tara:strand:+ start:283 stop:510 length:228 start_codon:yes stop_codon:yes gene_type:complete